MVNALSESLEVEIWRASKVYRQSYARGIPQGPLENTGVTERRGTKVTFKPDGQIFETTIFSFDTLSQRLRELSFLNRGILITLDDERDENKKHRFQYEGGIASFVEHLNRNKEVLHPQPIMIEGEREGVAVEVALQWNDGYAENIYSFANNINTHDGGTHMVGFKSALTRTLNAYATAAGQVKDGDGLQGEDTREGSDRGHQRQGPEPAVRRADQGQARQLRGEGHRREPDQREARPASSRRSRRSPSGSCSRCWRRRAPARPRARPATSPGARARWTAPGCPASSRSARSATPASASCTSSRATRPAARPSRAATARSRRSCRCAARS